MRLTELTLDDMLADDIVRLTMQRDGVREEEVRAVMSSLQRRPRPAPVAGERVGERRLVEKQCA